MIVACKSCKKPVRLPDRKLKKGEVPPIILVHCQACRQLEEDTLKSITRMAMSAGTALGPAVPRRAK